VGFTVLSVVRAPWGRDLDPVIAIDGQAGSGKSTVSTLLGERCGVPVLTTGLYFRAVTKALVDRVGGAQVDLSEPSFDLGEELDALKIRLTSGRIFLNNIDVTEGLRTPEVTRSLPGVSSHPTVRATILEFERRWVVEHGSSVVEGRDIGSVVFPRAYAKFFLTASDAVRQERRPDEGRAVLERDHLDSTRAHDPSVPAPDAVIVDTTNMSIAEVVQYLEEMVTFRVAELTRDRERELR
jgi:cytidylate kinase